MSDLNRKTIACEVLEVLGLGVLITDEHRRVVYANQKLAALWQVPLNEWTDQQGLWSIEKLLPHLLDETIFSTWVNCPDQAERRVLEALFFKDQRVMECSVEPYVIDGKSQGWVWTFRDISLQKKKEYDLLQRIQTYGVTGLPNFLTLKKRLEQTLLSATRHKQKVAIIILQINNFDLICDLSGRMVGDEVLKIVAQKLLKEIRHSDIVAQLADNKFCIVLQELLESENVARIMQEIENIAKESIVIEDKTMRLSINIGVSFFPEDGDSEEILLSKADIMLHNIDNKESSTFRFYQQNIHDKLAKENLLAQVLQHAIEKKQLMVYYQPIIDASNERLVGAEVLLRWYHPQYGFISPAEFIPIAERTGDIIAMGEWVFERVCKHRSGWSHPSIAYPRVAVNLSAQQLKNDDFLPFVKGILEKYDMPADQVCIELTESMFVGDEQAKEKLLKISAMGFKLALDDFGTGYSNLGYLSQLAFDHIKIDISFVSKILSSTVDAALVESIIKMAHSLNMTIIAEGVETKEQLDLLRQYGCDQIQGYYYSQPLPYDEFKAWIIEHQ